MATNNLTLELPNFEGPLDLLLHLIQSQKIDIYDIPIAQITKQYLDYLQQMQRLNLKIAGEYFMMSATLLRIKSQYLLPKNDFDVQSEEDPRDELVQQLVQYSVFKRVSSYFKERNEEVPVVVSKEASISKEKKVQPLALGQVSVEELTETFKLIIRKLKLRDPHVSLDVRETSINEMMNYLMSEIKQTPKLSFMHCALKLHSLSDVIALFLASLELCKNHQIRISQNRVFGDLELKEVNNVENC